jgi:hypothetical protein
VPEETTPIPASRSTWSSPSGPRLPGPKSLFCDQIQPLVSQLLLASANRYWTVTRLCCSSSLTPRFNMGNITAIINQPKAPINLKRRTRLQSPVIFRQCASLYTGSWIRGRSTICRLRMKQVHRQRPEIGSLDLAQKHHSRRRGGGADPGLKCSKFEGRPRRPDLRASGDTHTCSRGARRRSAAHQYALSESKRAGSVTTTIFASSAKLQFRA